MKKLFAVFCTLVLGGAMAMAQPVAQSTTPAPNAKTMKTKKKSSKKSMKAHHKTTKKSKKAPAADTSK
ncbi:MAG TPA: hypothetical protein VFY05_00655 [Candidatus Angelobacter sp.]|nr:hypothetical protein [Candidatus Angelobacter sp.]